jgi:hypothetical protein
MMACVQKAPPDLVQAVEELDRRLVEVEGARYAPTEYGHFAQHWVAVKGRILAEEDVIRWPWESNTLAIELRAVQAEGQRVLQVAGDKREADRQEAAARVALLERRLQSFSSRIDRIGSRVVLGQRPVETELALRQARSYIEQGLFSRSSHVVQHAARLMDDQKALLQSKLGRYADERSVSMWQRLVARTIEWSRVHHAVAVVINKADRRLTIYRNGRPAGAFPIRLGFNGILEKRFQGDGATPEGQYHITRKRDRGHTQFYRALVLDYPNEQDRRRFQMARRTGALPIGSYIGGQIEIHGEDQVPMSQTLGCVMLNNRHIDKVFELVEVGTPVTIVGALEAKNSVSMALAGLDSGDEDEEATADADAVERELVEEG